MIKRINPIFALLCAAALLATGNADAVVKRVDLLKKEADGVTQYIYCLSDHHIEGVLRALTIYDGRLDATTLLKLQTQFKNRLTAITVTQGDDLLAFAGQLGAGQFVLINEDVLAFDEKDKAIQNYHDYFRQLKKNTLAHGIGAAGFLPYTTDLFTAKKWPVINADCRQIELLGHAWSEGMDRDDLKARYLTTLGNVTKEISQSTAPVDLKLSSLTHLNTIAKDFTALLSRADWPSSLPEISGNLVDARVPHLILKQTKAKHILLLLGEDHIKNLLPILETMDYKLLLSRGLLEDNAKTNNDVAEKVIGKLDLNFMSTIAINLQNIFSEIRESYHGAQSTDSKQIETQNINSTLLTQPIINNNNNTNPTSETVKACASCAKKQDKMLVCARCKATSYCSRECQKTDWPKHKPTCKAK